MVIFHFDIGTSHIAARLHVTGKVEPPGVVQSWLACTRRADEHDIGSSEAVTVHLVSVVPGLEVLVLAARPEALAVWLISKSVGVVVAAAHRLTSFQISMYRSVNISLHGC